MTRRPALLVCALLLGLAHCRPPPRGGTAPAPAESSGRPPVSVLPHPALGRAGELTIADIAERVIPSVVNIAARQRGATAGPSGRGGRGLGSGVIVASGVVLTNNHVVEDADEVRITTHDKREFVVTVVGTDPRSDLAVLKVNGSPAGLTPIEMGDSARLRLGDLVLAVGNPFGVGQTVTLGIVSAKGRADLGIVDYEDFIQTDAAINPGNSGGALVDMEGRLVGINTAILSRSGGSTGIGFAIPTNMARPIMDSLLTRGRVVRGWLGVSIQDLDPELAAMLHLESLAGVVVTDVSPGGPAARGGLRRGDVVLRIDGVAVDSTGRLRNVVAAAGPRRGVRLDVVREGKALALAVDLEEQPDERKAEPPRPAGSGIAAGLDFEAITPELRQRYSLPPSVQGLVITGIAAGSVGARAGLRPGDVLLELNRQKVETVAQLREALARAQGQTLMLIWRDGGTFFVVL